MIKLLIVIHSLKGGGAERVLINLLKGLDRGKFSITLVLYEGVFDFPCPDNVDIEILDISASRNFFKLARGFILKIMALARSIKKHNPDIIFSFLSSTNVTVILAREFAATKARLIISEHTHPTTNLKNEMYGNITKLFMKKLYPKADKIVTVSEWIKQDLVQNFHLPENKIKAICNPVDSENIELLSREEIENIWFKSDIPVIVAVGRLTKQKGYPYLLRAFSIVREQLSCRLLIIGEGEDKTMLDTMAKELGIEKDTIFPGFQKNPFKYMAKSSLFVLSSLYEGFPNVILEAMTLGLAIVATDCPSGPSELIDDGQNGILVPVKDEKALAHAIVEVLKNDKLREDLGREAKLKAQRFALSEITKDYQKLFYENSFDITEISR
jgi:glycosyltransferase involved in cell wall biosynthesis